MNSNIPITWSAGAPELGPFNPDNPVLYRRWRDRKLADYPASPEAIAVEISNPARLTPAERQSVLERCRRCNMALLICPPGSAENPNALPVLGAQLGLEHLDQNLCAGEDGISAIEVREQDRPREYIPYTSRPLSWHTDGYYNSPDRQIRAWGLFCGRSAAEGGGNALLDPELAYILLRDEHPDFIRALMARDAMTIPANIRNGQEIRPARCGPVFSVCPGTGSLHMRYSARKRSILWKPDPVTRAATAFLEHLFSHTESPIFRHRLEPGQGLISNNVLHNRSAFRDSSEPGKRRLIYRARYVDRIAETGMNENS